MTADLPDRFRAVIVDDEEPARLLLREYLGGMPEIEVVAECSNGFEAVKAVSELAPDILILDVQMPKLDGFEVLELLDRPVAVVFATAFDSFAIRAFEVAAVDYLLKPFPAYRLKEAVARAIERIRGGEGAPISAVVRAARRPGVHAGRVLVKDGADVHVVPVTAIDYMEAQDDYVAIHAGAKTLLKQQPLGDLAETLDPDRFVRIHRSYVLNLDRLRKIEPAGKDSREAVLADGTRLPVSRSGYARLQELL